MDADVVVYSSLLQLDCAISFGPTFDRDAPSLPNHQFNWNPIC